MTPDRGPSPVIETERLILRRPEAGDLDGFMAFMTSDRSRFAGGVLDPHAAWRAFGVELGHWELRGFGMFAVTERAAPSTCLGMVGPWYPSGWPERELGWLIWPEAEGRGIAGEAAAAARDHAFGTLGWETAVSYIHPQNARSIALAERLGARRDDAAARPPGEDARETVVYRHRRAA
ncbi:N-acetyltransferase [Palleronia sediminis]|uniref:N-acetyltransferase n=1 Tax=Palleronia sediminis TaxID=2547833 RepID=A0A4V3BA56_9RHOB|nr:GNAT family N-acetyltransferase [Palleronia sediminis]TDL81869.1 N-acetyltransferase [Palleronia sediminis]